MSRYAPGSTPAVGSRTHFPRTHFRFSANERAPRAFLVCPALLLLLVPSFGCGLGEQEGEEQTTAP